MFERKCSTNDGFFNIILIYLNYNYISKWKVAREEPHSVSQPADLGVPDGHRRSRLVMCSSRFLMCWGGSESGDTLRCSNNTIQDSSKWMNMVRLWMYSPKKT